MQLSLCFGFSFVRQNKTKKCGEEEKILFATLIESRELAMIIAVKLIHIVDNLIEFIG